MIPEKTFREFNTFYAEVVPQYRSKYFVQVRDDRRTIQIFLRNFGWIEVTPLSFTQIYVNIVKNINNKQTHLFILTSTKELIKLYQKLTEDPNASLPKPIVYKEAPPSAPIRPRKPDKKAERKARKSAQKEVQKEVQKESPKEEKKLKEKEKKFKKELLEIEQQMKEEKEKKQEEIVVFYQPEVEPIVEEPKVENENQDEDLF